MKTAMRVSYVLECHFPLVQASMNHCELAYVCGKCGRIISAGHVDDDPELARTLEKADIPRWTLDKAHEKEKLHRSECSGRIEEASYRTVSLPIVLWDKIESAVNSGRYGYQNIPDFVLDSVRKRLRELRLLD